MRSLILSLSLAASISAFAPTLQAQAAAADALFESARTAMAKGDFANACEQFRASDQLDPAVGTELNLADCEEKRGRIASAWELYRAVSEKLNESDERVGWARERIRALAPRVPKLTLALTPNAPKNSAVRDGDVGLGSAAFGVALPLDPGVHELSVSAPGRAARTYHVTLSEGQMQSLIVEPGAESSPAAAASAPASVQPAFALPPPNRERPTSSNKRTLGFVIGGVGIAGLGVGAVAGVAMLSKKHAVDDNCHPDKSCNAAGVDAAHSAHTLQVVSNIGWVAGVLGLGAGAYLVLTSGGSSEQPSTTLALSPNNAGAQFSVARSF